MQPMTIALWEELVLSKTYFDRLGFIVAEDDENKQLLGFAHGGFGPNEAGDDLDCSRGVVSLIMVHPKARRGGIGSELLKRLEHYFAERGTREIYAGSVDELQPFYLGLYRGCGQCGVLESLPGAVDFYQQAGYEAIGKAGIWERELSDFVPKIDRNSLMIRRSSTIRLAYDPPTANWWDACTYGRLEQLQFELLSRPSGDLLATANVCVIEPLAQSWGIRAVELRHIEVTPANRRQGYATYLLSEVFRRVRELGVSVVQIQAQDDNEAGLALCQKLEFRLLERGIILRKQLGSDDSSPAE